jgi:hypothetical protein
MQHASAFASVRLSMAIAPFSNVGPHFVEIAFPSDFTREIFDTGVILLHDQQFQGFFNRLFFTRIARRVQRLGHKIVVDDNAHPHNLPLRVGKALEHYLILAWEVSRVFRQL